jgi:hypothetical protein
MVAERIQLSNLPQARHQSLMAVFVHEAEAEGLVARMAELGIEPREVSIIRVALGEAPKRHIIPAPSASSISAISTRYSTRGIILGGFLALLLGVGLYAANFLQLSFLEALLVHTLALVILGGVIGGAVGAILASIQAQKASIALPSRDIDSFIVVIKAPPHLIAQAESQARELGARKVFS